MTTPDPEPLRPTVPFVPGPDDDAKILAAQLDGLMGASVSAAEIAKWTDKERREVEAWLMAMPQKLAQATSR
jgi:hypothetical protein